MNYFKRTTDKLFLICLFLSLSILTIASDSPTDIHQARAIRGVVIEQSTNEPLPGVSVYIEGTSIGTVTDANGEYDFNVPSEDVVLVFSFIGKTMERRLVGGFPVMIITMLVVISLLIKLFLRGFMQYGKVIFTGFSLLVLSLNWL